MRNVFFLLLAVFFFSACSNGPNAITDRHLAQQCNYSPLTDSVRGLISAGLVHADTSHAGNPLICDSVYTLQFNGKQEWDHIGYIFLWAGIGIIVVVLGWYIKTTSSGNDSQGLVVALVIGIAIGAGVMTGGLWFNDYRDIKKADYLHYMQTDGNLDNWWKLPAQSY